MTQPCFLFVSADGKEKPRCGVRWGKEAHHLEPFVFDDVRSCESNVVHKTRYVRTYPSLSSTRRLLVVLWGQGMKQPRQLGAKGHFFSTSVVIFYSGAVSCVTDPHTYCGIHYLCYVPGTRQCQAASDSIDMGGINQLSRSRVFHAMTAYMCTLFKRQA